MAGKDPAISLGNLALESYYSLGNSSVITAEVSEQVKKNTIATGCCFAEVEVDIKLGKIKILHIINVHDSGKLINPKLAEMQVQGGMSMGIGYGLSEQLILDEKTGRPLNGTLLDYKLMTMMDTPDIKADFVELDDPIGPFGNKALGEPPRRQLSLTETEPIVLSLWKRDSHAQRLLYHSQTWMRKMFSFHSLPKQFPMPNWLPR